eukprot:13894239-Heterocapsa_arctica.AAC.1
MRGDGVVIVIVIPVGIVLRGVVFGVGVVDWLSPAAEDQAFSAELLALERRVWSLSFRASSFPQML